MMRETDTTMTWGSYAQLAVEYDPKLKALWYYLAANGRPCFNPEMLAELHQFQQRVVEANGDDHSNPETLPIRYLILASKAPGVFNLGGDLQLFGDLIRNRNRSGLFQYAKSCIDVLYPNAVNFDQPLTTITLVQGDALGGGFEAAISSNVVIAERSAKFGLPEVLFNLIPGMGAYSFLIRKTNPDTAKHLMMSGELISAQAMYDLGLVDMLAEDGEGELATLNFVRRHSKRGNSHLAMRRIQQCVNPITYEELIRITRIWVDAALNLTDRDLRMIERLVQAQNRRAGFTESVGNKAMEGLG